LHTPKRINPLLALLRVYSVVRIFSIVFYLHLCLYFQFQMQLKSFARPQSKCLLLLLLQEGIPNVTEE
jgi:hypothetical protein